MAGEMPSDAKRRTQIALVVGVAVVAVAVVSVGLWFALRPDAPATQTAIEPAQETSASVGLGVEATVSAGEATASPGSDAADPAQQPDAPAAPRPQRIAYRSRGTIYSAQADGGDRRVVTRNAEGAFALSPDGSTLALVANGALTLVDTTTKQAVKVGPAAQRRPVWMPDSSAVMYVRGAGADAQVRTVKPSGRSDAKLHDGSMVAVCADGDVVAVAYGDTGSGPTKVALRRGSQPFQDMKTAGVVRAIAATEGWVLVGVSTGQDSAIYAYGPESPDGVAIVTAATEVIPTQWGDLSVSPDQRYLAAASTGDDGFSRVSLIPLGGGQVTRIVSRYDQYLFGWSAGGDRILLYEGNAIQGEPVRLVAWGVDGLEQGTVAPNVTP